MCGIAGIVATPGRDLPGLEGRLAAMGHAMVHRGPDDHGVYVSGNGRVGLVNRRLAIVDVSSAGHMPMGNAGGTTWVTHNGEIYNAPELRASLARQGHVFQSGSDTEVILHGYAAWGPDVVDRLVGMFAFAVYDAGEGPAGSPGRGQGRLLLARDRLGIKPLYVATSAAGLAFASELKALRAAGLLGAEVDPAAMVGYLSLGSVPSPLTIYAGARELPPGSRLVLDVDAPDRPPAPQRYWRLPLDVREPDVPEGEAVAEVRALLEEAVRSHLISDVPLGAFLSGGLDSSGVVALMRTVTGGPIRTCSMTFDETEYSEAAYARAVADAVGAEHFERVVTGEDVAAEMDRILGVMDQPTIDGVNTYFVSKTAREARLTVALSGLGGDEVFGGYPITFRGVPRLLSVLRRVHAVPGGTALARVGGQTLLRHGRWRRALEALDRPASPASAYLACRGLFSPREVRALVGDDRWEAALRTLDPVRRIEEEAPPGGDLFSWVSRAELGMYTHNQLLRDTDVMSMAHSLEVRVPLLDHRLVENVLRLPAALKTHGAGPKGLLLRALDGLLPPLVSGRREKRGFVFPFERWLRGPLARFCRERHLASSGLLRATGVAEVRRAFEGGRTHWSRPWALAVLQAWYDGSR